MPKEASLWGLVKDNMPKEIHSQRIETGGTGKGVPDVNYCHEGKEIWMELKSIDGLKSELSPFQMAWLFNRSKVGGNCFVLIRKNNSKEKEIKLFHIKDMTIKELGKLNWETEASYTLKTPYNWEEFFAFILASV